MEEPWRPLWLFAAIEGAGDDTYVGGLVSVDDTAGVQ